MPQTGFTVPDDPSRLDRITTVVLHHLFDLAQQTARFNSGTRPWASLAVYDADHFALFTTGGPA